MFRKDVLENRAFKMVLKVCHHLGIALHSSIQNIYTFKFLMMSRSINNIAALFAR